MQKNPVVLWELASNDAEKSVEFPKNVFDWDIEYNEKSNLYNIPTGQSSDEFYGGMVFTLRKAKLPFLTIYIKVNDIDNKAKQIEEFGGYIIEPPHELPGGSWICLFNEPSGITLAMIQLPSSK